MQPYDETNNLFSTYSTGVRVYLHTKKRKFTVVHYRAENELR